MFNVAWDERAQRYRTPDGRFATSDEVAEHFTSTAANNAVPASTVSLDGQKLDELLKAVKRLEQEQRKTSRVVKDTRSLARSTLQQAFNNDWQFFLWFALILFAWDNAGWLAGQIMAKVGSQVTGQSTATDARFSSGLYNEPIQAGDTIAGYSITSGYGKRVAPIPGASSNHKGVDVGTPIGIRLMMISGGGSVECLSDPGGYGEYAIVTSKFDQSLTFLAGHLSKCDEGEYLAGQTFAATGNSGNSSGPHLHWEQMVHGSHVVPKKGFLEEVLLGSGTNDLGHLTAKTGLDSAFDKLIGSIVSQESSGNSKIVNLDSGALGKYQIMPANLASWGKQCVGRSVSSQQFLDSEQLQDQIANCKLKEYYDAAIKRGESEYEACASAASAWYSGDWRNKNSTASQGNYPSIKQYTIEVCGSE